MSELEGSDAPALTFDPVWLILERPRPNFDPGRFFAPGKLEVKDGRVSFGPSGTRLTMGPSPKVHFTCDHVVSVRCEKYGWGLVPRFVAIEYEKPEGGTDVAYFNDAEQKGWRPLLTGSNRRMAEAIRQELGIASP
jgi:hypothetical protein